MGDSHEEASKDNEAVSKLLFTWHKAIKAYDKDAQARCVSEVHKMANCHETVELLTQERVLEVLALMISSPPRREEELMLIEQAASALCKVLAHINTSEDIKHKNAGRLNRSSTKKDIGDVYLGSRSVLHSVPKITRVVLPSLLKLLQQGSIDGQKTAAWLLHFLACSAPDGAMNWTASQRSEAAKAMLNTMGGLFGDVRLSVLHALAMCMQRDVMFRADVAQAGGVPAFIRLLRDDDIALVTASAGALHCLVQDHKAYVTWVTDIHGVPELMQLLGRLPVAKPENRLALLQVIWTLECIGDSSEANAKHLLDQKVLPMLFHIITQAHTVSTEIQAAAATALAGIAMGKSNKEERPKIRDEVISQLSVPVLEDFKECGCRELQLVSAALMRFATPYHIQKCRVAPEPPKLGMVSEAAIPMATHKSEEAAEAAKQRAEQQPVPTKGALAVRGALSNFVGKEALVIGISNYEHLSKCKQAVRDAQDMSKALQLAGFRCCNCYDARSDMLRASFAQFEQRTMAGFLSCIFFAGHGAVFDNTHYILPTDFVPPPCIRHAAMHEERVEKAVSANVPIDEPGADPKFQPTKDDLRRIHQTAGNLDGLLQRLQSKGVRHTLVMLDPVRVCKKDPNETRHTAKSVTLNVPEATAEAEARPSSDGEREGGQDGAEERAASGRETQREGKKTQPSANGTNGRGRDASPSGNGGEGGPGRARSKRGSGDGEEMKAEGDGNGEEGKIGSPGKAPKRKLPAGTMSKARNPTSKAAAAAAIYASKPTKTSTVKTAIANPAPGGEVQTFKSRMADQLGWTYNGLKASLLLWAAGPGSVSFGAGRSSTATKNSLFTEQVLKYVFARHLNLRQGIETLVQNTREVTANQQIPGYTDDGLIGLDYKMLHRGDD